MAPSSLWLRVWARVPIRWVGVVGVIRFGEKREEREEDRTIHAILIGNEWEGGERERERERERSIHAILIGNEWGEREGERERGPEGIRWRLVQCCFGSGPASSSGGLGLLG